MAQEPLVTGCASVEAGRKEPAASADARFAADVLKGLAAAEKSLPCVYLYDARGSLLFEHITRLPEYYLTRAESEIILDNAAEIASASEAPVQVVELGSGTSVKTIALLEALREARRRVTYMPVDVCGEVLEKSALRLRQTVPGVAVKPIRARYRDGLESIPEDGEVLLLWLGSSIGNLDRDGAASFLRDLRERLAPGDRLLIGIDLAKDVDRMEAAYNDSAGVTAEFNLNLLRRINRELGGEFELERFEHVAFWNGDEGRIEMHLESRSAQSVSIAGLGLDVAFRTGERIHTESSYKYTQEEIEELADRAGLAIGRQWFDSRKLFSLQGLRVVDA